MADIPKVAGIDLTDLDLFANGFPHDVFAELRAMDASRVVQPPYCNPVGRARRTDRRSR